MPATQLALLDKKLALIDRGRMALAEANTVEVAKQVRDQAEAIECYLKQQTGANGTAVLAAELKILAERKLGELLGADNPKGKRPRLRDGTLAGVKTLPPGVNKKQSHRWQTVARVPARQFTEHVERAKEAGDMEQLTTSAVVKLAKSEKKAAKRKANSELNGTSVVDDLQKLIERGEKFGTIYADPPWKYGNQATRAATDNHYPTMTVDEICALPIGQLAADDCQLHLWTTNGFLFECQKIFEAWGFEFKSSFVWCKQQLGIGNYWRVSHEFLLTAVRGSATFEDKSLKSWQVLPRGEHSAKPAEVRRLVAAAGVGPRLELFGRSIADGWTVWGNQVNRTMFDGDVA